MNLRILSASLLLAAPLIALAADGSWLRKVPAADHARSNPFDRQPDAVSAGQNLYRNNCAHCHGDQAEGRGRRPALAAPRIAQASDGDLAWLLKNGNVYRGMPSWSSLPEPQRWQLVAYLRSLNTAKPLTPSTSGGLR